MSKMKVLTQERADAFTAEMPPRKLVSGSQAVNVGSCVVGNWKLYVSIEESQARESRAREEGEKVGLGMALQLINEEAQGDLDFGVFLISQMLKGSSPEAKERLAKTIAEQLERAAASRSGEGEAPGPDWERE